MKIFPPSRPAIEAPAAVHSLPPVESAWEHEAATVHRLVLRMRALKQLSIARTAASPLAPMLPSSTESALPAGCAHPGIASAPKPCRRRLRRVARSLALVRHSLAAAGVLLLAAHFATGQVPIQPPVADAGGKRLSSGGDPAALSLDTYLSRVRLDNTALVATAGAIWTDAGRLTRMSTDVRAMRPHDLISVVVSESLAASTDGTVKNSRASNASSAITSLFGKLHAGNALQNLVNQNSASGLNAQGTSATSSSLTTTLGGQVVEVLPNGMLVIEAARQVEFSQQTQTIILRGLVRPEDISQQNQILSTAISSLELQVRGKGIVNDYTHRQNPLVRLLQNILVF
jgi:flagellar L-ring protein FlgH